MQGAETPCREAVLDLTACDREPICIPESIQPHGVLFGIARPGFTISAVSENAAVPCGMPAAALLGTALRQHVDVQGFSQIAGAALRPGQSLVLPRLHIAGASGPGWRGTLHAQGAGPGDDLLLEAEPLGPESESESLAHFEQFHAAMLRLQMAEDFSTTAGSLVAEVRRLTGFARVMLYRFAPDWSGEVIAEERDGTMPSYLGLHFPASDIPVQARALYTAHPVRQIPDARYEKVKLLHPGPAPFDLSPVALRSVSPIHLAYLRNMGVGAAMSVSLLRKGVLWGMLACHHPRPHHVPADRARFCTLLADWAIARFGLIEEAAVARTNVAVKTLEARLLEEAAIGENESVALFQAELLRHNSDALLRLLGASGLALSAGGAQVSFGAAPAGEALRSLLAWLAVSRPDRLVTDHLAGEFAGARDMGAAAGMLAVRLSDAPDEFLIWFRPEIARTVTWAGNPAKPAGPAAGEDRLTPRQSFAAWTEEVKGRSRPWSTCDIVAANSLRDALTEIVARRARVIQRMNLQLLRSNEELESFAYVASHDLKEPLRQIEMFGTLLQRAFGRQGDAPEKIERWFDGITGSTRRLRGLIDHLAQFSRLGSEARPFAPVDTGALFADALRDFESEIAATGCTIETGALPMVACDAIQIRQVFQNLVGNALKYRHPERPPVIRISAALPEGGGTSMRMVMFRLADNGIGFEQRYQEQIFKPFERLHSVEKYEGNGLGLAICRKVIDRHGGTITASSRPGEGSVFTFTLPERLPIAPEAHAA